MMLMIFIRNAFVLSSRLYQGSRAGPAYRHGFLESAEMCFRTIFIVKKRDLNLRDRLLTHAVNHNSRETHDLRLLIDRLPAVLQKLHQLYYAEGLSIKEISIVLDKAEGTIKYLLYRLRNELREML